jgi:hypothetical protein
LTKRESDGVIGYKNPPRSTRYRPGVSGNPKDIGREVLLLEQFAHQLHGCSHVAPSLHQEIENFAFIVDRAPEPIAAPQS